MTFTILQRGKTPFQAIKTRSSKGGKIDIFSKEIQARKMSFTIFQSGKTPFQAIKTRSSESRKIDIFPKGLSHGFGPKMAIFATFFFLEIQAMKMSFTILQSDKTPFQAIKTRSLKDRKIDIFPNGLTHGFGPKNVFYDILEW